MRLDDNGLLLDICFKRSFGGVSPQVTKFNLCSKSSLLFNDLYKENDDSLPFYYFFDIIESDKEDRICVTITNETMQINNLIINAQTTFFEDDKILRSIKLPVNYDDSFLLKLETQGYTNEELTFNRLGATILMAKRRKNNNLQNALYYLETYGIKYDDLEKIVNEKLNI